MTYEIVVLVKQVPDMNGVRIDRSTGKPVMSGQLVMNSADEYAVEEALRIKEAHGANVTVVSAGPASTKDVITRALAMGADQGVLVEFGSSNQVDTLAVAQALAGVVRSMPCDLLLAGYNSDDSETAQVVPQVAELVGMPFVSSVVSLLVDDNVVTAQRDMEDGKQTVRVATPVAITAIAGLNEPRYPSLKGIMAARKKPLETVAATINPEQRLSWSETFAPERESSGVILQDVAVPAAAQQFVAWLKAEKLI